MSEMTSHLADEEERGKHLAKVKGKYEGQVQEMEDQLNREKQVLLRSYIVIVCFCLILVQF